MEKIKVLFICHGNICRSPMAEFVLKDLTEKRKISDLFEIDSAATSREEIGNPIHYGTKRKLDEVGITGYSKKRARQMTKEDYEKYDYLIGMDQYNMKNMLRILGGDPEKKIYRLLEFSDYPRDIADPWYTGDFEQTYTDILEGCEAFLNWLKRKNNK